MELTLSGLKRSFTTRSTEGRGFLDRLPRESAEGLGLRDKLVTFRHDSQLDFERETTALFRDTDQID